MAFLIAALAIAADQLSKLAVAGYFNGVEGATSPILPGILNFTYIHNTGAAFGIFTNARWPLFIFAGIASIVLAVWILRTKNKGWVFTLATGLVLGGAVGNMIDRGFIGYVRDFIHFNVPFAVFNVADSCVVVGSVMLAVWLLFLDPSLKKKEDKPAESGKNEAGT